MNDWNGKHTPYRIDRWLDAGLMWGIASAILGGIAAFWIVFLAGLGRLTGWW
jgi:hypothetical protein